MQNSPKDFCQKLLGRQGEELTCKYLKKHGYRIVKRNYTTPFGEADIIANRDGTYCFVEVKARAGDGFGHPAEAVNEAKQRKYRQSLHRPEDRLPAGGRRAGGGAAAAPL